MRGACRLVVVMLPPLAVEFVAKVMVGWLAADVASLITWMAGRVGTAVLDVHSNCAIERASGDSDGMPLSTAVNGIAVSDSAGVECSAGSKAVATWAAGGAGVACAVALAGATCVAGRVEASFGEGSGSRLTCRGE